MRAGLHDKLRQRMEEEKLWALEADDGVRKEEAEAAAWQSRLRRRQTPWRGCEGRGRSQGEGGKGAGRGQGKRGDGSAFG